MSVLGLLIMGLGLMALVSNEPGPIDIKVANISNAGSNNLVTMAMRRTNAGAYLSGTNYVQLRIGGHWESPVLLPRFWSASLMAGTNVEQVTMSFPAKADACRFSMGYRVGRNPQCRVYIFLLQHGIQKKFPALSRSFVNMVPREPRLRRFSCELEILTNKATTVVTTLAASN
jgi:hypothetical protein